MEQARLIFFMLLLSTRSGLANESLYLHPTKNLYPFPVNYDCFLPGKMLEVLGFLSRKMLVLDARSRTTLVT